MVLVLKAWCAGCWQDVSRDVISLFQLKIEQWIHQTLAALTCRRPLERSAGPADLSKLNYDLLLPVQPKVRACCELEWS